MTSYECIKVEYKDIYPYVNLVYYGNQRQLEYDFIVAPGEDLNQIIFGYNGAEKIEIDDQGDLVLFSEGGEIRMKRPYIYQEIEGKRVEVEGSFKVQDVIASDQRERGNLKDGIASPSARNDKNSKSPAPQSPTPAFIYGFQVPAYDTSGPLIIDPVLAYSTYLGGSDDEESFDIAIDSFGNAYVTGEVSSIDFPTANPLKPSLGGLHDAFVTKLNVSGNALIYSTFLGGNANDNGSGIAVDHIW